MKVEINFDTKEITLKSQFKFSDLNKLKKMLGDDFDKFTLIPEVQAIQYSPAFPWVSPDTYQQPFTITCDAAQTAIN